MRLPDCISSLTCYNFALLHRLWHEVFTAESLFFNLCDGSTVARRYEGMEAEEADQLRAMEIQSIKGGLGTRGEQQGFGRCGQGGCQLFA